MRLAGRTKVIREHPPPSGPARRYAPRAATRVRACTERNTESALRVWCPKSTGRPAPSQAVELARWLGKAIEDGEVGAHPEARALQPSRWRPSDVPERSASTDVGAAAVPAPMGLCRSGSTHDQHPGDDAGDDQARQARVSLFANRRDKLGGRGGVQGWRRQCRGGMRDE